MLNRHGCASWETACTVNRGVAPGWYQYCGDETRSVTAPRAHARARLEARGCAALRSGDGAELERGEGDGLAGAPPPLTWAGVEPTVFAPRGGVAWLAVERAASIPLAAQLMVVSNPMPTARTSTRRRQYVACEIVAGRGRAPRGGSAFDRRLWSISVTMEDSHRMSLKARRKKASSAHALPPPSRPRSRGRPSGARAHGERARTPPTMTARRGDGGWTFILRPSIQPGRHSGAGPAQPR